MNIGLLCKRFYTNRDLITKPIGRLYHFPLVWQRQGHRVYTQLADYYSFKKNTRCFEGLHYHSRSIFPSPWHFEKSALAFFKQNKVDIIVASGDALMGHLGLRITKMLNIPFAYDLYHDYAYFGSSKIPGMKQKYYNAVRNANLVGCESDALATRMRQYQKNAVAFTQGTDPSIFKPMEKIQAQKILGLNGQFCYLGITGSIDNRIDIALVNEAIQLLNQTNKNRYKLLVAGINAGHFNLNAEHIHFIGEVAQTDVPTVLSACDVLLLPMKKEKLGLTCNPCKLSEYIACQRPIVSTRFSNMDDYLKPESLCDTHTAKSLMQKILHQLENPTFYDLPNTMTWNNIGNRYLEALKACIDNQ